MALLGRTRVQLRQSRPNTNVASMARANPSTLRKFARTSWADRAMLAEAFVTLAAVSIAIKALPFRSLMTRISPPDAPSPPFTASRRTITRVRWAVTACADRAPWRAVCFQRGVAAHLMLRRRGVATAVHYGVKQNAADGLKAHVWVTAGGHDVVGGREAAGFTRLATFPPDQ